MLIGYLLKNGSAPFIQALYKLRCFESDYHLLISTTHLLRLLKATSNNSPFDKDDFLWMVNGVDFTAAG